MRTIKTVTIYSVGLLGGSIGAALKLTGFSGTIIGLSSPASIATAIAGGSIDEGFGYTDLAHVLPRTDLLILCSPINAIKETIAKLATLTLPEGLIITDVGSTKYEITKVAKVLPGHVHFIGGHPMAGSEKHGAAFADPYLFQNAMYVLTPQQVTPSALEHELALFLSHHLGCRHIFLNPHKHDTIVAMVSHVPHLLAVALMNCAQDINDEVGDTLALAAGGFRDMTRIASSPYSLWNDILSTNTDAVVNIIDRYSSKLATIKQHLLSGNLEQNFNAAAASRNQIASSGKGFIHPLFEVLVRVPDQSGAIARMATMLATASINIKDIEVLKVREGDGGTIRLAFESKAIAQTAAALLNQNNFTARERD